MASQPSSPAAIGGLNSQPVRQTSREFRMTDLSAIQELEERLLSQAVRRSPEILDSLISDDFLEFGSSGRIWSKVDVLNGLDPIGEFSLSDIQVTELGTEYALITYQLALIDDGNRTTSLRSSIWRLEDQGWRVLFHQGTLARSSERSG
jgi:hypothetical protein